MNTELVPRAILVTGAASGIGRAVAFQLAAAGCAVAALDRDAERLRPVVDELSSAGAAEALALPVDVSDAAGVATAMEHAVDALGRLDGLVSTAGVLEPGSLETTTAEAWQRHFDVNVTGVFNLLQRGAPRLRDGGSIVVVSSNAARVPRTGMLAYSASKAAASALARCAGLELADRGIRCNAVEPGSTDTPMQRTLWPDPGLGARQAIGGDPVSYRVGIPLGRIGSPDDVAGLVSFLLSDAARHITMQRITVDGGASL
ncbi:2,3-dihydro-2,3-dihydroxybenzoate dehydrogenase [Leucobacter celer]|uniref:2,3-dihydro-2,3-dihydroxybenzoate dehydrogenase n=1 Tax=Leucobacter celer TaxID=668625 RepID=UPI0006A7DA3B|nr:2,3-dihydro-2,3-dihydroxybenzoate dehydrogenase [Leucobacter celer]